MTQNNNIYDIATTMIELIITLASAIIVGMVTFYESVLSAGVSENSIKLVVVLMAITIITGLLTLSRVIGLITGNTDHDPEQVLYSRSVRILLSASLLSYFFWNSNNRSPFVRLLASKTVRRYPLKGKQVEELVIHATQ